MHEPHVFARAVALGGLALGVISLILWRMLPIPSALPPFWVTPLLALGYGGFEWWRTRGRAAESRSRP